MALFKYTTLDSAKLILESQSLKWSCPLDFNDPLDVRRSLLKDFLDEESLSSDLDKEVIAAVSDAAFVPAFTNPLTDLIFTWKRQLDSGEKTVGDLKQEIKIETLEGSFRKLFSHDGPHERKWNHYLESARILCLTRLAPDAGKESSLMWAHYSGEHTGVAFEFDFDQLFGEFLKEVQYVQEVPEVTSNQLFTDFAMGRANDFFTAGFIDLFATKAKCWAYEEEWRCISSLDVGLDFINGYFLRFDPKHLLSITFGVRTSDWQIRDVVSRCNTCIGRHVKYFKMSIKPKSFDLVRNQIDAA